MRYAYTACAILAVTLFVCFFQSHVTVILNWIGTLGLIAPVFFLFMYALATILFVPTMIFTLAGGALFGPVFGTMLSLLGATVGASCAFCISRYLMFDRLSTTKNRPIAKIIQGVEGRGWVFVALIRLIPIIPFNLVNYGLGITQIKFSHYLIITLVFLIPTEIIITYCGYAGLGILSHPQDYIQTNGLIFLLLLGTLLLAYLFIKRKQAYE
jgi:uncharacterized membrane protein YdjX (TVP38/TMEM64 family)